MAKRSAVVEELEDDLELIEDEDETPAPKKNKSKTTKTTKAPKEESVNTGMGASWLAEHVNEELGTEYTAAQMRVVLRKMAKDGDIEREVGTDRARYSFTGEKDPTVRAVLKRVRSGEADADKKERLAAARSGPSGKAQKRKQVEDNDEVETKPAKKSKKSKVVEDVEDKAPAKKPATRKRRKSEDDE